MSSRSFVKRRGLVNVLDNALPVLDFAESAFSLIPIPGLSLIPKALSLLLQKINDIRANVDARAEVMGKIEVLSGILKETVDKLETVVTAGNGEEDAETTRELLRRIEQSKELRERVQRLLAAVEELTRKADKLKGGSGLLGFSKGVVYSSRNDAILSGIKSELDTAVDDFKFRGQLSIEMILGDLTFDVKQAREEALKARQEAEKTRQAIEKAEEQRTLDSIPRAPADYRSVDELKSQFMEGTRQELFEELNQWSAGTGFEPRRRLYFLRGGAGLGKSSIAHQLCQRLDTPGNPSLGASFFFVRGSGDLESTRLFFPTLARQLASSQATLRPHILRAVPTYLEVGERQQMKYALEALLAKPLSHPSIVVEKPVILVIDGLDECKERELVPELLRGLLRLLNTLPWLHIFLASRPVPHILAVLTSDAATAHVHRRSLDDTLYKWKDDITRFLKMNVPQISPSYAQFVERHPNELARLIDRAGGVFIFAHIALNFLDTFHDHPEEQFALLLKPSGVGLSALDALYLQVLRSALPLNGLSPSSPRITRLQSFLCIIAVEQWSLTPKAMALLENGLSEEDVIELTDRLRSVLMIDGAGRLMPIHTTFLEFLQDPKRCIDPLYQVNPSEAHARLASGCFAVLTLDNLTPLLQMGRLRRAVIGDGAAYAVEYGLRHMCEAEYSEELRQQLMDFCGLPMFLWMRAYILPEFLLIFLRQIPKWLEGSVHAKDTFLATAKCYAYSTLWWRSILRPRHSKSTNGDSDDHEDFPPPPDITLHDVVHEMMDLLSLDFTYEAGDDDTGSEEAGIEVRSPDGATFTRQLPRLLLEKRLGYKIFFERVSSVVTEGDLDQFNIIHAAFLALIRREGVRDVWLGGPAPEDWLDRWRPREWRSGSYETFLWA